MAQAKSDEKTEKSSPPTLNAAELAATQRTFLDELQESNKRWLDRMQHEVGLASEFASKFAAARSIPAAMATYQEWTSRCFEMMAEDGRHLLAETQRFMETGTRLFSNGSPLNRFGIST